MTDQKQKIIIMIGALFGVLLSALDQTIIATAIPKIVKDFNGLDNLSWIFSGYMLAMTATIPIFGKLSDIYGRKSFFLSGIAVFILGSVLCGASESMGQLIFFRIIQGIGAGALAVTASAIIGDIFPPAERGKWQGVTGGIYGVASVLGPMLGWFLAEYYSWRWGFYINLPLGLISVGIISVYFRSRKPDTKRSIDFLGSLSIAAFLLCFIGIFETNSLSFASSLQTILLIAWSVLLFCLFIFAELRAIEPVLPLDFFRNRTFAIIIVLVSLTSIGMYGPIIYIPLMLQKVFSVSASSSWVLLAPMMLSLSVATIINGQIMSRTGKYKTLSIMGILLLFLWLTLLSSVSLASAHIFIIFAMALIGFGIGMTIPVFNVAIQNAFDHSKIGITTASSQLFRNIGWTVWVALLGITMNRKLLTEPLLSAITENFQIMSFMVLGALAVVFFLPETPLRKHNITLEEVGRELEWELGQWDEKREQI